MLKFANVSVCEVFGYQLATLLGVPVPRAQGIWTDETNVPILHEEGIRGRIGLLVEYLDDWRSLTREQAIALNQRAAVRAVALCVFDRHEWGEFGVSTGKVYFVDL